MEASALRAGTGIGRGRGAGASFLRLRSDEQLVELFRSGHEEAFRVIHDRYRARLFAYTRQMLPGSRQDAEDAIQDVFIRAYAGLRANNRHLALRAWLYRIAHNRCVDQLRKNLPVPAEEIEATSREVSTDPIAAIEQRETLEKLVLDVQRLPEQQRSALLLRELSGMSYQELADSLDLSVPAIKSLLVRARTGLTAAAEARETDCDDIREELVLCHDRGVRPNALARRHLKDCTGCREFREDVRSVSTSFAALVPALGPVALIAKLLGVGSAASASGTFTGGAGGAATGVAAASGGAATGATAAGAAAAGAAATGAAATGAAATGTAATVGGITASHVATFIAAAVIAGGGAVAATKIPSGPATPKPITPANAAPAAAPAAAALSQAVKSGATSAYSAGSVVVPLRQDAHTATPVTATSATAASAATGKAAAAAGSGGATLTGATTSAVSGATSSTVVPPTSSTSTAAAPTSTVPATAASAASAGPSTTPSATSTVATTTPASSTTPGTTTPAGSPTTPTVASIDTASSSSSASTADTVAASHSGSAAN